MKRPVAALLAIVVLAGCGGNSARPVASTGCKGLPTAKHSTSFLVLFGAVSKLRLTKRDVCARFGRPTSIRSLSSGREAWTYGKETVIFQGPRLIAIRAPNGWYPAVPIGG